MHRIVPISVALCLMMLCTACGEPTIDASSKAAYDKSTEEIMSKLEDAKKEQFAQALQTLGLKYIVFAGGSMDEASMTKRLKETFDGKTADQVIAEAAKLKAENAAEMKKLMNGN